MHLSFKIFVSLGNLIFLSCLIAEEDLSSFGASEVVDSIKIDLFTMRNWTSREGAVLEAKLLSADTNLIEVLTSAGKRLSIPVPNLSDFDRKLLQKHTHATEDLQRLNFSKPRVWMSVDGRTMIGTLSIVEKSGVYIYREDNRLVRLEIDQLSPKDRKVLALYSTTANNLSTDDVEYMLCMYKWRDQTNPSWNLQLEFEKTPAADGRKLLKITHKTEGGLIRVEGSWVLGKDGILSTAVGNGGGDVRWICPTTKNARKTLVSEIRGLFNYFGFLMASNLTLVPDH